MSLPPVERGENGRFVKSETETPKSASKPDVVHPLSRVLFGWVESPRAGLVLLLGTIAACVGLTIADLVLDRHEYVEQANVTGFYSLWGFGAFALAVLSGWPLSYLLRRDEDYYGEAETTPDDVESKQ